MKRIQVLAYCDGNHDEPVRSTKERTISIDGSKPVVLDVCDPCDVSFTAMLELMERGATAEVTAPKKKAARPDTRPTRVAGAGSEKSRTCPECGLVSATRSSLGQHTRQRHGKGLKAYPDASWDEDVETPPAPSNAA